MGLPDVRWPDGKEMTPQIDLRERLDLYYGMRPIYLYHEQDTPLKNYGPGDIDFVIVRENTEGLYVRKEYSDGEIHRKKERILCAIRRRNRCHQRQCLRGH